MLGLSNVPPIQLHLSIDQDIFYGSVFFGVGEGVNHFDLKCRIINLPSEVALKSIEVSTSEF